MSFQEIIKTEKMGERMEVAKITLELLNEKHKSNVTLKLSHGRRGRARLSKQYFSLPIWALTNCYPEQYIIYYTIHEYTHCLLMMGHNETFKNKESELLKEFGIEIEYARAYPKRLYANGEIVYERTRKS